MRQPAHRRQQQPQQPQQPKKEQLQQPKNQQPQQPQQPKKEQLQQPKNQQPQQPQQPKKEQLQQPKNQQPQQPKKEQTRQPNSQQTHRSKVSIFFETIALAVVIGILLSIIAYLFAMGLIFVCNVFNLQTLGDFIAKAIYAFLPICIGIGIIYAIYEAVRKQPNENEQKK